MDLLTRDASELFTGANQFGQNVLTWLAESNTTRFTGDLTSLLVNLEQYDGPVSSDYLGYVAFGTETLHADSNVTFSVPKLKLDVEAF